MLFYSALRELGVDVDVRRPDHDLSGYDLIVAPALQLVGPERARHLADAACEALLLAGPRTGFRTMSGRVHEEGQPGPLTGLLGCSLRNIDSLRPGLTCHVGSHEVEIWAESYTPRGGEVVQTYADGPMEGDAAVVRHGNAVTLGAWSVSLIREILAGLLSERDVPHQLLPEGVRVARRGELATWMNFYQVPATIPDGSVLAPVSFAARRI
jgi:beta-galactosidase